MSDKKTRAHRTLTSVFGVELGEPLRLDTKAHSARFCDLLEIDALDVVHPSLSVESSILETTLGQLSKHCDPSPMPAVDALYLYSIQHPIGPDLDLEAVRGFSAISLDRRMVHHTFFERAAGNRFRTVPELCVNQTAPVDVGALRLLHFGSLQSQLPSWSTIVAFVDARRRKLPFLPLVQDRTLQRQILLSGRVDGAPTLGLSSDLIFEALLDNDPGSVQGCGHMHGCESGNGKCASVAGPEQYCMELDDTCAAAAVAEHVASMSDRKAETVDFALLHQVRDEVLADCALGREYISYYYIASSAIRYDTEALEVYQSLLEHLTPAIRRIVDESSEDDAPLVTTGMYAAIRSVLSLNRESCEPEVVNILEIMESDFRRWLHVPKSAVMAELLAMGSKHQCRAW